MAIIDREECLFYDSRLARRRFFVTQIDGDHAELTGDDARHLARVLRAEAGQRYELSDNRRAYLAEMSLRRAALWDEVKDKLH